MSDHALMAIVPGVRTLVDTCAGVKKSERVLIVTDTGMDQGIVAAFALLCREREAEVVITNMLELVINLKTAKALAILSFGYCTLVPGIPARSPRSRMDRGNTREHCVSVCGGSRHTLSR